MAIIDEDELSEEELRKVSGSLTLTDVETYYQSNKSHEQNEAQQRKKSRAVLIVILSVTAFVVLYFGFGMWMFANVFAPQH